MFPRRRNPEHLALIKTSISQYRFCARGPWGLKLFFFFFSLLLLLLLYAYTNTRIIVTRLSLPLALFIFSSSSFFIPVYSVALEIYVSGPGAFAFRARK